MTKEAFNPSIWEKGSFDENTRTLITGRYGFGGWQFSSGLNLSAYRTITVELGNDNTSSVSFRIFDKIIIGRNPQPMISVHHVKL